MLETTVNRDVCIEHAGIALAVARVLAYVSAG